MYSDLEQIVWTTASPMGETTLLNFGPKPTISMIVQKKGSTHTVIKPSTMQFKAALSSLPKGY